MLSNRRLNCDRKPIVGDYCIRNSVKVTNSSLYCELRGTDNVPEKKIYTYERFFPTDGGYCYFIYYPLSVFATRRRTVYEQLAVCCVRWMFLFKCSLVQLNEQTNALSSRIEGAPLS